MHFLAEMIQMIIAIAIPISGGFAIGFLCPPDEWYKELHKSKLNPPNWVFAPAWTVFYTSMGYASYLVWKNGGGFKGQAKLPLMVYICQLLLNWAWTPIFFRLHNIKASLIDQAVMLPTVVVCILTFYKVNKTAGYLLVPYILWLGFATYLNVEVYRLN